LSKTKPVQKKETNKVTQGSRELELKLINVKEDETQT
jgi:hypothetical protein